MVGMLTINKIESTVSSDVLRIEMFLSDYCNYQCWYCSDEYHSKTVQWPELEPLLSNFLHFLNYYKAKGKRQFIIQIGGGEPTLWPGLVSFVKAIKYYADCTVSITSNGSRTLRWWKENARWFDHIALSVHHEQADPYHIAQVGDAIYNSRVATWATVMMDPDHWDKCVNIINVLKQSQRKWSISATQIQHQSINYTDEQKKFLDKKIYRDNNLLYEIFVNRKVPKYSGPKITANGLTKKVPEHWLLLNGFDNFKGWLCNVGIDTVFINKLGDIKGSCGNKLYGESYYFNLFEVNFKEVFEPDIKPVICEMTRCICQPEVNCTKENINGQKFIKILRE